MSIVMLAFLTEMMQTNSTIFVAIKRSMEYAQLCMSMRLVPVSKPAAGRWLAFVVLGHSAS